MPSSRVRITGALRTILPEEPRLRFSSSMRAMGESNLISASFDVAGISPKVSRRLASLPLWKPSIQRASGPSMMTWRKLKAMPPMITAKMNPLSSGLTKKISIRVVAMKASPTPTITRNRIIRVRYFLLSVSVMESNNFPRLRQHRVAERCA